MSMKVRFWFGMLAAGAAIACALALLIAALGSVVGAAAAAPESASAAKSSIPPNTYEGVVTDTRCGAKHSAAMAQMAGDCTRVCVHAGEGFALVDGDQTYVLEGEPAALKRVAGERARIVGTLNGNTLSVVSVSAPAR